MKKITKLCLLFALFFAFFITVNLFQTRDEIELGQAEHTGNSFELHLKGSSLKSDEVLQIFSKESQKYGLSVIKDTNDSSNGQVKSVIFNQKSFPNSQFRLPNGNLFKDGHEIYASYPVKNLTQRIPTFSKSNRIKIQSLNRYFDDKTVSVNGTYTVILPSDLDQAKIKKILATDFGEDSSSLYAKQGGKVIEYINRNLIMFVGLIILTLLVLGMTIIYLPLSDLKGIGVKKLNGYSNASILWDYLKPNVILMLIVIAITMIGSLLYFSYLPSIFLPCLMFIQILLLLFYLLLNLITYLVIDRVTIGQLLKDFLDFRIGNYLSYFVKLFFAVFTTIVLILTGQQYSDMQKQVKTEREFEKYGNVLTLDQLLETGTALEEGLSNSRDYINKTFQLFQKLETETQAQYFFPQVINPQVDFLENKSLFKETEEILYVSVNHNYLKTLPKSLAKQDLSSKERLFLVPKEMVNDRRIKLICQNILHGLMGKQPNQKGKEPNIIIRPYSQSLQLINFSSNFNLPKYLKNPIIGVFNDHNMLIGEKYVLSDTGVDSSPYRIKNTSRNLNKIRQAIKELNYPGFDLKFSTVNSILGDKTESAVLGLRVVLIVIAVAFGLGVFASILLLACYIQTTKKKIAVRKLLGWKLFDSYKDPCILMGIIYVVQLIVLVIFQKSWISLVLGIGLIAIDVLSSFIAVRIQENKKLSLVLKGEE